MREECFLDESGGWLRERQVVCGRGEKEGGTAGGREEGDSRSECSSPQGRVSVEAGE